MVTEFRQPLPGTPHGRRGTTADPIWLNRRMLFPVPSTCLPSSGRGSPGTGVEQHRAWSGLVWWRSANLPAWPTLVRTQYLPPVQKWPRIRVGGRSGRVVTSKARSALGEAQCCADRRHRSADARASSSRLRLASGCGSARATTVTGTGQSRRVLLADDRGLVRVATGRCRGVAAPL